eukprot:UN02970
MTGHKTDGISVDFGESTSKINDIELIKSYIVIFDQAIQEIMHLLRNDSLSRFYSSKDYKLMLQNKTEL